jgi:hypothetical protein
MALIMSGVTTSATTIEEAVARLRREGKRVVAIYFTVLKPRGDATEEDAISILKALRTRDADYSIWVTFTRHSDTAYLDAVVNSMLSGGYPEGLSAGGGGLLDVTYVIIPRGNVKAGGVYDLVRGLSGSAVLRLGGSRFVVKVRVFGNTGELGVLRSRLTGLGVYDTYLLEDGSEGELVVNLPTPSQVLDRGVYEVIFGLGD